MRAYSSPTANQKWESLFTLLELASAIGVKASGSVELTGGIAGTVNGITADGVQIMSGAEAFDTDLNATAQNVVDNINAFISAPNYTATRTGAFVNIFADEAGIWANGLVIASSVTTITSSDTNLANGTAGSGISTLNYKWSSVVIKNTHATANLLITESNGRLTANRPVDISGYELLAGQEVPLKALRNETINGENIWVRSNGVGSFSVIYQEKS